MVVAVTGVRVHLPVAPGDREEPTGVRLLASQDGIDWHVLDEGRVLAEPPVFGPGPGEAPWRRRFLRVQAMHDGVLALDQVEIFGAPAVDLAGIDAGERAA